MASESRPLVQEALREFRTKGSGARVIGIRESRLSFWTLSMVLHCALLDFGAMFAFALGPVSCLQDLPTYAELKAL